MPFAIEIGPAFALVILRNRHVFLHWPTSLSGSGIKDKAVDQILSQNRSMRWLNVISGKASMSNRPVVTLALAVIALALPGEARAAPENQIAISYSVDAGGLTM